MIKLWFIQIAKFNLIGRLLTVITKLVIVLLKPAKDVVIIGNF